MNALPAIVAFDLDDTLAPSKSPLAPEMAELLAELVARTDVAVISGGRFAQFESQLIAPLAAVGVREPARLHVLPTCGTQYYRFAAGGWDRLYVERLSVDERERAFTVIEQVARDLDLWPALPWGAVIEDRESQITFSALGQLAPIDEKANWDPTGDRKRRLRDAVAVRLPDLEVRTGGSTSLDVTRRWRDKAYGIGRLCEQTGRRLDEILFFGDQLQPGGNDNPVLELGVACVAVSGWPDTARQLHARLGHAPTTAGFTAAAR
ncbi:HAD-IIB family hydrolase [Microbacterium dextranolyticum]|uniref:phosphomannomutase n=1 Tax=Microbacterium dextranolyticum TaxID=36806 RepID=A0A9W6M4T2_9MICO|nr:HAD-IIB family hydrolase [Microbacterium dextranolyticum]MBM7461917.1 HAD superfamily hydrolase (TIGR01484 family) [Microbacterium dextranolyticum]GLJ94156.1 phosphomannomutase [Microbacterium dextranolyticum]